MLYSPARMHTDAAGSLRNAQPVARGMDRLRSECMSDVAGRLLCPGRHLYIDDDEHLRSPVDLAWRSDVLRSGLVPAAADGAHELGPDQGHVPNEVAFTAAGPVVRKPAVCGCGRMNNASRGGTGWGAIGWGGTSLDDTGRSDTGRDNDGAGGRGAVLTRPFSWGDVRWLG